MNAAELRALGERLCAVEPHDYEDRVTLEAAAEIIELIAWAEGAKLPIERLGSLWWVRRLSTSDTLLDTLRRAREAAR